jgi:hypothetical protein
LQPEARAYDLSLALWLDRQGASPAARQIMSASWGPPLEKLSLLRMMMQATRSKIALDKIDPATLKAWISTSARTSPRGLSSTACRA